MVCRRSSHGLPTAGYLLNRLRGDVAVSRENLAIVGAIHEALARGQSPATLGLVHPDMEYVNPSGAVEPGTRRGVAAYEDAVRSMNESFEDVQIEVHEMKAVGDRVVVLATYTARGRRSGAQRQNEDGYVWTIRDGQAVRFEWFNDPAKALEAVGLV
jgi:ketosteroid isomerase-like protein